MAVRYKQRCMRCRKNYVVVSSRQKYVICYDCQKGELKGDIKDPKMKKMFAIPEKYYIENGFLRNIKMNYLRYGNLTEKQIDAFKKVFEKIKQEKAKK